VADGTCIVVRRAGLGETAVPITGRLFVGRSCDGIDDEQRLVVDDAHVSRVHLEIRLDDHFDRAFLVDTSTNGTWLNGVRLERNEPVLLRPGSHIRVGDVDLEFVSDRYAGAQSSLDLNRTTNIVRFERLAMVVGDVIGYSTITETADSADMLRALEQLYAALRQTLTAHAGRLKDYVGDAFFAIWDADADPAAAAASAADFALSADAVVQELAPSLPIAAPDGAPITMGWAVVLGEASVTSLPGGLVVVGDTTNLAFRLSGIAGREAMPAVLAAAAAAEKLTDTHLMTEPHEVVVKGRNRPEMVRGLRGR
jgi:class 3 adenylate cyclase